LKTPCRGTESWWILHQRGISLGNLRVVLPDQQLLATVCSVNPTATLADVTDACEVYSKPLAIVSL